MERWLQAALDYIPRWLEFQMRALERPGLAVAICHQQRVVLDLALGHANLASKARLTTGHQFRIASHSKSFTAAGILKLREQGRLQLDDAVGRHVGGLHPKMGASTLAQLLSHSAGTTRDGPDASYFQDRRPFLQAHELMQQLAEPPAIEPNTRFKYSNHGFALLGQVIEAVSGESYGTWMRREIIAPAGLGHTHPDVTTGQRLKLAQGHSGRILLGERVVIPGDPPLHAIAPAGGFVATAADLARFYAQLAPDARHSVLSPESRREMLRRHWTVPHSSTPAWYGLGVMQGSFQGWDWFGHTGGLQGFVSRSCAVPHMALSVSMLANSNDAFTWPWVDGVLQILQGFATHGAPSAKTRDWSGRWWNLFGATDLVPVQGKVFALSPGMASPFTDATELSVLGKDRARMSQANGYASFGEEARLVRDAAGRVKELWLGGSRNRPEAVVAREMRRRYPS